MAGKLRNLLAAVGAVVVILIALSIALGYLTRGAGLTGMDKVAVLKVEGVITDSSEISRQIKDLGEMDDVKAVVVRIDSPGGAVGPSQEIHGEIRRLRKTKKVVASMGTIAASGGYYVAVAADRIVANPGTITGSIGVLIEFINAEELLSKVGLKGYVVKSGKYKDVGSPLRQMSEEEKKLLQEVIDDVNGQFIAAVSEGRKKKPEEVAQIADGRIFTGAQAKAKGLIDEVGGLTDAIDIASRLAGITGEPEVIYFEKTKFSLWNAFMGESAAKLYNDLFTGLKVMYLTPNPVK